MLSAFSGAITNLFGETGGNQTTKGYNYEQRDLTTTKQLEIDQQAVDKILSDLLKGDLGIANIFTKENVSGLYNTATAKMQADNFLASVVGELAKLQAKEVSTEKGKVNTQADSTQKDKGSGIFGSLDSVISSWF